MNLIPLKNYYVVKSEAKPLEKRYQKVRNFFLFNEGVYHRIGFIFFKIFDKQQSLDLTTLRLVNSRNKTKIHKVFIVLW